MRRKKIEHIKKYQCDNEQMEYMKKKWNQMIVLKEIKKEKK